MISPPEIIALLDRSRALLRGNDHRETRRALRELLLARLPAYPAARATDRLAEYAMYLCMALHAELDQEDDESTGTAELAFAALAESLARYPDARYEITRQRVFLLYRFPDYLVDAWIETFPREHKDNERLRARARALDAIARATLADARDIQRDFPERFDADNELNDIINTIPPPSPPRDPGNVDLTRELLHGYLKVKYSL